MATKQHPSIQLEDSIHDISVIGCSKCSTQGEDECLGSDEAARGFYKEGWRATETRTYCPKCAKKYLKLKK